MRRRDIVLLGAAALTAPRLAGAQQAERMRHIGYLTPATGSPENLLGVLQMRSLVEGLRELGWFDGRAFASAFMLPAHVRLLLVIPLLFLGETVLEPRVHEWFLNHTTRSPGPATRPPGAATMQA